MAVLFILFQLRVFTRYETWEITCKWQDHRFVSNKDVSQALYQTLQTTKMNLKTVRLTRFQKPQLQSVSIFFKFVHPCLHLYLYLILTFWAVIFMFHSIWWQFPTVLILIKQYNNNSYSEAEAYMLLSEVMNIWKSYTRTARWRIIWKKIIEVIDATFAVAKRKPEKKIQACTGFEPLTSAIPVQRSTNWANKLDLLLLPSIGRKLIFSLLFLS